MTGPHERAYDRVNTRLAERTTGRNGSWLCPAHDDSSPSLSVSQGRDGVVLHCHAGCDVNAVLTALDLTAADLFDTSKTNGTDRPEIVDTYPYVDENGDLLYEVVRYRPKGFRQRRPDPDGGWIWRLEDTRRVLYRLPHVIAAMADGRIIYITEGEKDADAIVRAGECATTCPQGAGKWRPEYTETLAGYPDILIVADRDTPGYRHARAVATELRNAGCVVHLLQPATGKDVAEHLGAGLTLDQLDPYDPDHQDPDAGTAPNDDPTPDPNSKPLSAVERLEAALLTTGEIKNLPPPEWLIDGYLTRNSLALLYGPSGTYKTFLGIDMALHLATGSWWNGQQITRPSTVLYVIAEGVAGIGARLNAWQTHHRIYNLDNHQPITWLPRAINLSDPIEAGALTDIAGRLEPDLIVIDTLARCTVGAEENSAKDMGIVVEHLDHIRRNTRACILSIHHTGKDAANGARGSSALRAAMDTELEMAAGDPLVLKVTKQKDAAETSPLQLAALPTAESCVLTPSRNITTGWEVGAGERQTLTVLIEITVAGEGGTANGAWREAASHVSRATFERHRAVLVSHGLVTNIGTAKAPRYIPTDTVDTAAEPEEAA